MAIAIGSFRGAKSSTRAKETQVVGAAYAQAISQYQADHANRNPKNDTATMGELNGKPAGPKNLLDKPYIKSVPDGVIAGRVGVSMTGDAGCNTAPEAGFSGFVRYCPDGDGPNYAIRVDYKPADASWGSSEAKTCYLGNTVKGPRC